MNYIERLNRVNKDYNKRTVWECIDRPIRPLIFELARIGMIPKFSCCGFTYQEENNDEPKSHINGKSYVHFYIKNNKIAIENFNLLKQLCIKTGWAIWNPFAPSPIVEIHSKNCVSDNLYQKKDNIEESIHQYEGYVLKIDKLAYTIQNYIITESEPIIIYDGNNYYKHIKEWQVKPKQDFIISVKDYYEKYGKIIYKLPKEERNDVVIEAGKLL